MCDFFFIRASKSDDLLSLQRQKHNKLFGSCGVLFCKVRRTIKLVQVVRMVTPQTDASVDVEHKRAGWHLPPRQFEIGQRFDKYEDENGFLTRI